MFPETGSFLEEIFTELKSMYEFSTGGGNSGNSFSELFVNYFNNDKNNPVLFDIADCPPLIQKFIEKAVADISSSSTLNIGSWAWIGIDMNLGSYNYFGTNKKMNQSLLSQIVIHELDHGVLRMNNLKIGQNSWLLGTESEIFASYIENRFLQERNLPIRNNYFAPNQGEAFFKSSLLYNFNLLFNDNSSTIKNMQILNNFRKSLQTVPNTDFIFK